MIEIPECFYRVSAKALILDETRTKFLICKEESGYWELPGGGLDWGTTPQEDIPREIEEEMGLVTSYVAEHPSYFITDQTLHKKAWIVNVVYETTVQDLNFTPSDECVEIRFVDKDDLEEDMDLFPTIPKLAGVFSPKRHIIY